MSLCDNKILVTAGCSGLGRDFSLFLLEQGATVIPTSRSEGSINEFLSWLPDEVRSKCHPEILAFKDENEIQKFVENIKEKHENIYGLVNCAVCRESVKDPFERNVDMWTEHYMVNVFLTTNLTMRVVEALMPNGGSVVNVSSFYSKTVPDNRVYDAGTIPTSLIYASSKASLNYITQYLAVEYAKQDVRVNAILPAGIRNPDKQSDFFVEQYNFRTPMRRMGESNEFNDSLLFLLSPDNKYCTGQLITIDGGWSLL